MVYLSPLAIFWLLLAGTVVTAVVAYFHPPLVKETAVAVAGLAGLLWLVVPERLPPLNWLAAPATVQPTLWTWRVDDAGWQLGGVLLLLVVAVLLALDVAADEEAGGKWAVVLVLFLAAAGLMTLWANLPAGLIMGWTLVVVAWSVAVILAGSPAGAVTPDKVTSLLPRLGWLLSPLFFLWLAAALTPADGGGGVGQWPVAAQTAVLVAALLQMGVWPLQWWRPFSWQLPPAWAALVHTVPVLVGVSLLARLALAGNVVMAYSLFLTAFGLLGLLLALRLAWSHLASPRRMVAALALAQTHLVLLAGVWVGAEAAVAEARVLLLATAVLLLATRWPAAVPATEAARWWRGLPLRMVGPVVALAALAGLPLTAGFAGRSGLYGAWLQNGRYLLLLVAALLHVPLVAAVVLLLQGGNDTSAPVTDEAEPGSIVSAVVSHAALLLPALGLLSLRGLSRAGLLSWLLVLLPPLAGWGLTHFLTEVRQARAALHQAFALDFPLDRIRDWLSQATAGLGTAVREATLILEGDGGLLWLLALLLVFLLARFL